MTVVEFDVYGRAVLNAGVWTVPRVPKFAEILQKSMELIDLSPSIPNPETYMVNEILTIYSGVLVETDESSRELVAERVY